MIFFLLNWRLFKLYECIKLPEDENFSFFFLFLRDNPNCGRHRLDQRARGLGISLYPGAVYWEFQEDLHCDSPRGTIRNGGREWVRGPDAQHSPFPPSHIHCLYPID